MGELGVSVLNEYAAIFAWNDIFGTLVFLISPLYVIKGSTIYGRKYKSFGTLCLLIVLCGKMTCMLSSEIFLTYLLTLWILYFPYRSAGEKMETKLISVIVPCYNVERYLNRCVESIVKQTYPYLEIILVDDGSTDNTARLCDVWAKKDSRIKVIHKKNGGLSDARNSGIQIATGKWLGFVDSDDYLIPTMYENLYANRFCGGITVCGYLTEENKKQIKWPAIDATLSSKEALNLYIENELQAHLNGVYTYWGSYAVNKLYDSSLFKSISYPIGKKYEDMYVILPLIYNATGVKFISKCGYVYVQNLDSITHTKDIIYESLYARITQKEQLRQLWNIEDPRLNQLIAFEYFLILYRYTFLTCNEQKENNQIKKWAWDNLQKLGYNYFSNKLKIKLFLFIHYPCLISNLRKFYVSIKG